MKTLVALCACATILAGCSMFDALKPEGDGARATEGAASARPSSADELVTYLAHLRSLGDSALATEAARYRAGSGDLAQVKSALALSLSAQADEAEILALVEGPAKREGGDRDVRAMASFLHAMSLERRRLKESAASAGTRLRDERRALELQRQRAESLQQRAEALQQKLDALTDLEKSLADRQPPPR
jgi:hypothetical protein